MIGRSFPGFFGVLVSAAALSLAGCSSNDSGGGSGGSGTGGSGGSMGGTGGSMGGTGGSMGGTGGSMGGTGGSTGGTGGMDGGTGTAGDHLLISEVGLEPGAAEFVEIYNPTSAEVDLTDYYLSDNSAYYKITSGPWGPQGTPQTDFLAQFPSGTKIAAGAVLVIAADPGFEATYGNCPDLILNSTGNALSCGGGSVPAMTIPTNGSVGSNSGSLISNDREMIVLFTWDGSASTVKDVDYVTWQAAGASFDDNTRSDKSAVTGYQPDTPRASQKPAVPSPAADGGAVVAIERCGIENGETLSGGNGLTGHDETSEDMSASFQSAGTPSPGTKNGCL